MFSDDNTRGNLLLMNQCGICDICREVVNLLLSHLLWRACACCSHIIFAVCATDKPVSLCKLINHQSVIVFVTW